MYLATISVATISVATISVAAISVAPILVTAMACFGFIYSQLRFAIDTSQTNFYI